MLCFAAETFFFLFFPPLSFSPNQSEARRRRLFRSPPFKIASAWCYCRIWWRTVLLQADGQIDATVPPAVCFKKWTVWWVDHCLNSHTETSFNAFLTTTHTILKIEITVWQFISLYSTTLKKRFPSRFPRLRWWNGGGAFRCGAIRVTFLCLYK